MLLNEIYNGQLTPAAEAKKIFIGTQIMSAISLYEGCLH